MQALRALEKVDMTGKQDRQSNIELLRIDLAAPSLMEFREVEVELGQDS